MIPNRISGNTRFNILVGRVVRLHRQHGLGRVRPPQLDEPGGDRIVLHHHSVRPSESGALPGAQAHPQLPEDLLELGAADRAHKENTGMLRKKQNLDFSGVDHHPSPSC